MNPLASRLLSALRSQSTRPNQPVSPLRLRQPLQLTDLQLATEVYRLAEVGLVGYDGQATTAFNDPIALSGYHLTNVYLTEKGWEQIENDRRV